MTVVPLTLDELRSLVLSRRSEIVAILFEDAVKRYTEACLNAQIAKGKVECLKAEIIVLQTCMEAERARLDRADELSK